MTPDDLRLALMLGWTPASRTPEDDKGLASKLGWPPRRDLLPMGPVEAQLLSEKFGIEVLPDYGTPSPPERSTLWPGDKDGDPVYENGRLVGVRLEVTEDTIARGVRVYPARGHRNGHGPSRAD